MKNSIRKIPFIGSDIDGVLKKGREAIPKAKESIKLIKDKNIPLILITNSGGDLESNRADILTNILDLKHENEKYKINHNQLLLCHSPMKNISKKYKDKIVLVTGVDKYENVVKSYGFNKYITIKEYAHIYHNKLLPYKKSYTKDLNKLQKDYRNLV